MNELDKLLEDFGWDSYLEVSNDLTDFNEDTIDDDIIKFSAIYSSYYAMMVTAKMINDGDCTNLSEHMAQVRSDSKQNSTKKLTARDLDDLVEIDEETKRLTSVCRESSYKYNLLKGLIKSMEAKKDMLIQSSSNRRAETKLYSN
tara:strand:+ start:782 stop:1216 length:435 start_codon:yes stop_codon:yes gene_type:complete